MTLAKVIFNAQLKKKKIKPKQSLVALAPVVSPPLPGWAPLLSGSLPFTEPQFSPRRRNGHPLGAVNPSTPSSLSLGLWSAHRPDRGLGGGSLMPGKGFSLKDRNQEPMGSPLSSLRLLWGGGGGEVSGDTAGCLK